MTIWTILGYDNMENSPKRPWKATGGLRVLQDNGIFLNTDVGLNFLCNNLVYNRPVSMINLSKNQTGIQISLNNAWSVTNLFLNKDSNLNPMEKLDN